MTSNGCRFRKTMLTSYILNMASELFGKKWRGAILVHLSDGQEHRYGEIKRNIPGCSVKVLSEVLDELERNKLITRTQYNTIPVKVTYKINPEFIPVVLDAQKFYGSFVSYIYHHASFYKVPEEIRHVMQSYMVTS